MVIEEEIWISRRKYSRLVKFVAFEDDVIVKKFTAVKEHLEISRDKRAKFE